MSVTAGYSVRQRRRLVLEAVPAAAAIGVSFFLLGRLVLGFLNIQPVDLQIAGGLLLLIYAVVNLLIVGKPSVEENQPVGIVPLATPLIVGPAVLTLGLVLVDREGPGPAVAALLVNLVILAALFLSVEWVLRVVPLNAMRAISKVIDLLLAAIGVAFIREGVQMIIRGA